MLVVRYSNLFNRTYMESQGLDWDSYWNTIYWTFGNLDELFKCWNFTLPNEITPSMLGMVTLYTYEQQTWFLIK